MAYRKFYYIIFPETFIFEVPSWMVRACKKSRMVTELNFELKASVFRRFYFRFARFYAAFKDVHAQKLSTQSFFKLWLTVENDKIR